MAAVSLTARIRVIQGQCQQISAVSAFRPPSQTSRFRENSNIKYVDDSVHELSTRSSLCLNIASVGTSQSHGFALRRSAQRNFTTTRRPAANTKVHNHGTVICRAASHVDKYEQCKCIEDALTSIMTDTIQHCLAKENDVMRSKVLDQMGTGLAALCRVSVRVAAASSNASMVPDFSTIRDGDLEQVRRLLHLTSLPFSSTDDVDFKRLTKMLQTTDGSKRTLSASELSQICERLGSDLVQCVGPLVMCFPELPFWAKHRALLLPAEVAGKVALSLLAGPSSR